MEKLNVFKVTLSSGKVVLLRELKIKHQELAAMAAAPKAAGDTTLFALLSQKELLKQLIVQVNGKPVKPAQLEDLDGLFSFVEFNQLNQALNKLGGDDAGKYQLEVVTSGDS